MTITSIYLLALLIVLALPYALWRLLGGRADLPLVVVQILAGIVLGPGVFGALAPAAHAALFRPEVIGALNGLAWWGVMLFVFVAGLELDLTAAWRQRRETAVTAGLALAVPLVLGGLAGAVLVQGPGWVGAAGTGWQAALGIGMACAVTALPILILFLSNLGLLRQPLGQRVLRYASLDDIAIWAVLALVLLDWDRLGRQAVFALLFIGAALAMRRLLPRLALDDRWIVGLIWLTVCGLAADWAGLHYMVGAFLAGAVLDAGWFGHDRIDAFRDTLLLAVMPVYFLSTGLRTDWDIGGLMVFLAAGLMLAAAVGGKLAGVWAAGRLLGWTGRDIWLIGWLLQTKALIMIVFANILLDRAIITGATFTALLLMALVSTALTMPVVGRILARTAGPDRPSRGEATTE